MFKRFREHEVNLCAMALSKADLARKAGSPFIISRHFTDLAADNFRHVSRQVQVWAKEHTIGCVNPTIYSI